MALPYLRAASNSHIELAYCLLRRCYPIIWYKCIYVRFRYYRNKYSILNKKTLSCESHSFYIPARLESFMTHACFQRNRQLFFQWRMHAMSFNTEEKSRRAILKSLNLKHRSAITLYTWGLGVLITWSPIGTFTEALRTNRRLLLCSNLVW